MGHYGGRPREYERPGASNSKKSKEMRHGRLKNDSPEMQSIADRKKRIKELERAISQQMDPLKREPLYEQYANAIASCPPHVYLADDIKGIHKASRFYDDESLRSISRMTGFSGSPLPLHHLVKILSKDVFEPGQIPGGEKDHYLYITDMQKLEDKERFDIYAANLRALEGMILSFSGMILPGRSFELDINGTAVQVPYSRDSYRSDKNEEYQKLKGSLKQRGIRMSEEYILRRINDGGHKVGNTLDLTTQMHSYKDEECRSVSVAISSIRLR